jgi:hypothetical protein
MHNSLLTDWINVCFQEAELVLSVPGSTQAVRNDRRSFFVVATDRFISPFYRETVPRPVARVNNTPFLCHTPALSSSKDSWVRRIASCSPRSTRNGAGCAVACWQLRLPELSLTKSLSLSQRIGEPGSAQCLDPSASWEDSSGPLMRRECTTSFFCLPSAGTPATSELPARTVTAQAVRQGFGGYDAGGCGPGQINGSSDV